MTPPLPRRGSVRPRFRAVHEEVVKLDMDFGSAFSGVLTDNRGRVRHLHPLHNFAIVSYNPADLPPEARAKVGAAVF